MLEPKETKHSVIQRCIGLVMMMPFMLVLSSCVTKSLSTTSAEEEYQKLVNHSETSQQVSVPDDVSEALFAENESRSLSNASSAPVRFDVSVNAIAAQTFFVSLVSEAGVNVVAHPDIEGVVSLDLKNVTIEEVLAVVRDVYGYEYKFKNGIYTIYPRKLRTEIFPINYLDVQRVGVTDTSVLIGKITSQNSSNGSASGSSGGSDQGSDSANLLGYLELGQSNSTEDLTPGTRVQTLSTTDFWSGLHETLTGIVGSENEGSFVMTNPQAGIVVVRALPAQLSTVRSFLEQSELSVQRQVVLETKILEVKLNDSYEAGINWSAISGELALNSSITGGSISDTIFSGEGTAETVFTSALAVTDITKLLNMLDRQGDVSVLSSPRISTVNNQKAVIRVGSDEFFVTGISNSTVASAAAVTSTPDIQLSSFFSGISLDVTPQISDEGEVILHVHPIVSNVQDQLKEIQVGDDNFSLPLALRDVRESDSIVKASTGQIVVLGGLMQETSADVSTKRAWLGDIPVLNIFFKHEKKELRKTELVILMRPIVMDDESWDDAVENGIVPFSQFGRTR